MRDISERTDLLVVRTARAILFACFFLSGFTGLLYEIAWVRLFSLVFGNTVYSTAAVIAAFMGGLGAGGWWAGRFIEKRRDAVLYYALAEFAIGIYALAPGALVKLLEKLYPAMYAGFGGSAAALVAVKAMAALLILALPTFCMGASLPLLARFFASRRALFGNSVSTLYGLNTLGAVAGTFLTGFIFIRFLGVRDTVLFGMVINIGIGLLALVQHRKLAETEEEIEGEAGENEQDAGRDIAVEDAPSWSPLLILAAVFAAGCVSISLEVAWTRALALIIGSSIYAFTMILLTFLLGISLGSFGAGRVFRSRPDFPEKRGMATLGICLLCAGITSAAGLPLLRWALLAFEKMLPLAGGNYYLVLAEQFAVCVVILIAPALMFGAAFPIAASLYAARTRKMSSGLGRVYFWNTMGAISGSLLTGFVLIPAMGVHAALVSGLVVILGAGAALTALEKRLPETARGLWVFVSIILVIGTAAATRWDRALMTSAPYLLNFEIPDAADLASYRNMLKSNSGVLFYADGLSSTVTVRRSGGYLSLQVNGKTDASSGDADTQIALGLLPLLMHPGEPRDVAMIGMGSGMSAGAALQSPTVRKLDIVEIEAGVVEASKFFDRVNFSAGSDERTNIYIEDGRNYFLTHPDTYDVIISEPSNPWIAGVADLYTLDFYTMAARRLNEGGVFAQWIQGYNISPESIRMFLATFSSVFPYSHVFLFTTDIVVVGSVAPLEIDAKKISLRFRETGIGESAEELVMGLDDYGLTAAHYVAGPAEVARLSAFSTLHTDDRPELGFAAPMEFSEDSDSIFYMLTKMYPVDVEKVSGLDRLELSAADCYGIAKDIFQVQEIDRGFEKYIHKALAVDPNHAESMMLMGEFLVTKKKYLEAASYFRMAMESGAGVDKRMRFVFFLLEQGMPDDAEALMKPLGAGAQENPGMLHAMAAIRQGQGRLMESADFHLRAADMIADEIPKSQSLFSAYLNMKQAGKSDREFMREVLAGAYTLRPGNTEIAMEYARLLLEEGDIPGAGNAIVAAYRANPDDLGLKFFMIELRALMEAPAAAALTRP